MPFTDRYTYIDFVEFMACRNEYTTLELSVLNRVSLYALSQYTKHEQNAIMLYSCSYLLLAIVQFTDGNVNPGDCLPVWVFAWLAA